MGRTRPRSSRPFGTQIASGGCWSWTAAPLIAAALTEFSAMDFREAPPRGLGVRVVRDLVRGLGGRIVATTGVDDHGSRIIVVLPVEPQVVRQVARHERPATSTTGYVIHRPPTNDWDRRRRSDHGRIARSASPTGGVQGDLVAIGRGSVASPPSHGLPGSGL